MMAAVLPAAASAQTFDNKAVWRCTAPGWATGHPRQDPCAALPLRYIDSSHGRLKKVGCPTM
jgi:hypothetical protein